MASLSDILTAIQNGVIAVNNLIMQVSATFTQIVKVLVDIEANARTRLTAATTYYISTAGNDAGDGLTPATAWLTFAHAAAILGGQIDFGGQTVTLQAVAGHAGFTTTLTIPSWVGGGALIIDLGGGSIATTSGQAVIDNHQGTATIQNGALSASAANTGFALDVNCTGTLFLGTGLSFGTCGSSQIRLRNPGAVLFCQAPSISYNITGGALAHLQITSGEAVFEGAQVTINNVTTFSAAFLFMNGGFLFAGGNWNVTAQTVHGTRFTINAPAAVTETHGNLNFFPGDVAGTVWTPAAYA